jgi:hypothetical protein
MAITQRDVGAWAASNATTQTVTLPTHQTGDILIVRTIRKPFTNPDDTVINDAGWTQVAAGVANGATANGNGTGSMGFKAFWKFANSSAEPNPTVTWGTTSAPGACVAVSYQRSAAEGWIIPTGNGGGDATARTSQTSTIASHISVTSGDLVDFFRGQCDDSGALTVPQITQTGVTFNTVTEYPATALLSGTSNDIAADGGYRIATAGTSSAAAVVTGTSAASEQHGAWMTRLRVAAWSNTASSFTANAVILKTTSATFTADAVLAVVTGSLLDEMLADSPTMLLRLNESSGTLANDSSSGGIHDGTLSGATFGAAALVATDTSVNFAGGTNEINVPHNAAFNFTDGPFTLACVVDFDVLGTTSILVAKGSAWNLYKSSSNIVRLVDQSGSVILAQCNTAVSADTRYLIAATYDGGTTGLIYINGAEVTDETNSGVSTDNSSQLTIGGEGGNALDGRLAYVAVYPTVVSAARIATWWAAIDVPPATVVEGSFTANAIIKATVASSFTANAIIFRTQTGSFTANAVLKKNMEVGPRLFYDSFTDDDGTELDAHTSDSGHSWIDESGGTNDVVIQNNRVEADGFTLAFCRVDINGQNIEARFTAAIPVFNSQFQVWLHRNIGPTGGFWMGAEDSGEGNIVLHGRAVANSVELVFLDSGDYDPHSWRLRATGSTSELWRDGVLLSVFTHMPVLLDGDLGLVVSGSAWLDDLEVFEALAFQADAVIRRERTATFTANAVIKSTIAGSFSADAVIKKTDISATLTANAIVRRNDIAATFAANSVLLRTQTATASADAVIFRTIAGSFTADAIIKREIGGSFTANAWLAVTVSATFTANAVIKATIAGSFTANAVLFRTISGSFTADSVLFRTISGSFSANAVVLRTISGSLTSDSVLLRTQAGSFTANAVIKAAITGNFSADAILKRERTGTFTANAVLLRTSSASFTADAIVLRTQAFAPTADAVLFRTMSGSFTADAVLMPSFTANAIIKREQVGSFTASAWLAPIFSADAVILRTQDGSFTANAWVLGEGTFGFSTDAVIYREQIAQFAANAVLKREFSATFSADAVLLAVETGSAGADAVIAKTQTASFNGDAVLLAGRTGGLTADAVLLSPRTASFTADAVLLRTQTASSTADAVLLRTQAGSFTADAVLNVAGATAFTADAVLLAPQTAGFSANAVLRLVGEASFLANAAVQTQQLASLTADSVLARVLPQDFSGNAIIRTTSAATFTGDAFINASPTAGFTGNAVLYRESTGSFLGDAVRKVLVERQLDAEAILRVAHSGSSVADAVLKRTGASSFLTDAIKLRTQGQSFTADATQRYIGLAAFSADAVIAVESYQVLANAVLLKTTSDSFTGNAWFGNTHPQSISATLAAATISATLTGASSLSATITIATISGVLEVEEP